MDCQIDPIFSTTTADGYNLNPGNKSPLITTEEVRLAIFQLSRDKGTGLDGIPNEILSLISNRSSDIFVNMYNQCLRESVFPVE